MPLHTAHDATLPPTHCPVFQQHQLKLPFGSARTRTSYLEAFSRGLPPMSRVFALRSNLNSIYRHRARSTEHATALTFDRRSAEASSLTCLPAHIALEVRSGLGPGTPFLRLMNRIDINAHGNIPSVLQIKIFLSGAYPKLVGSMSRKISSMTRLIVRHA